MAKFPTPASVIWDEHVVSLQLVFGVTRFSEESGWRAAENWQQHSKSAKLVNMKLFRFHQFIRQQPRLQRQRMGADRIGVFRCLPALGDVVEDLVLCGLLII